LSPEEAASVWMQYLTAYGALIHYANLQKGQVALFTAATGGQINIYGALDFESINDIPMPWFPMIAKGISIRGYTLFELTDNPDRFGTEKPYDPVAYPQAKEFILAGLESGALKPMVAKVFSFDRIVEAHDYVENKVIRAKQGEEQLQMMRESGVFADDFKLTFDLGDKKYEFGLSDPEAVQFYDGFVNGLKKYRYNVASNVEFGKDSLTFNPHSALQFFAHEDSMKSVLAVEFPYSSGAPSPTKPASPWDYPPARSLPAPLNPQIQAKATAKADATRTEGILRREIIGYERYLKELARKLRQNMTLGEVLLWQRLKRKQMRGYDFDRQRPIDRYIVDFYCKNLKLAIEIDGSSHDGEAAKVNDDIRQERLESLGVRFLRFTDADVKRNMKMVVDSIDRWIDDRSSK
jgi:very-short-patch-repair endonuclease